MKAFKDGKWVQMEYTEDGKTLRIIKPEPHNPDEFKPDFIIDGSLEEYAFGIHEGENFTYNEDEIQTVKDISKKYNIAEVEVYRLVDFVKTHLPTINHKDLTTDELKGIQSFIDSNKNIETVSFKGDNFGFIIKDPDLIEVLTKYVKRRYNFSDTEGNKSLKKLVARTIYNRLTKKFKLTNYDATIVFARIFSEYHIALVNDPIKTEREHGLSGYLNYLEVKGRSFLTETD